MAYDKLKPEHAGAKNGGGGWGHREDVKKASSRLRRLSAKEQIAAQIFEAQETIRQNMDRQRTLDEVARMSGNETAARMLD